jgi:hypothetical protein
MVPLTLRKRSRRRMPASCRALQRDPGTDLSGIWGFGCQLRSCVCALSCDFRSPSSCIWTGAHCVLHPLTARCCPEKWCGILKCSISSPSTRNNLAGVRFTRSPRSVATGSYFVQTVQSRTLFDFRGNCRRAPRALSLKAARDLLAEVIDPFFYTRNMLMRAPQEYIYSR